MIIETDSYDNFKADIFELDLKGNLLYYQNGPGFSLFFMGANFGGTVTIRVTISGALPSSFRDDFTKAVQIPEVTSWSPSP